LTGVLVSDRDMRFTSAFWTDLHAALGASLVFGSPHHHNTTVTSKAERENGVIADVPLRSFAGERGDDLDGSELVPLIEFAINGSASTLGSSYTAYTPFCAERGQHPRLPLLLTALPDAAVAPGRPGGGRSSCPSRWPVGAGPRRVCPVTVV
jgi:hypothetical protein